MCRYAMHIRRMNSTITCSNSNLIFVGSHALLRLSEFAISHAVTTVLVTEVIDSITVQHDIYRLVVSTQKACIRCTFIKLS
jgi:hypothetical protein